MKLNSFEEISKLDSELAGLFLRPEMALNWIYAMEKGIKEWVGKHNKQYWEVVRFVSERRGILGKQKKDRKTVYLTRQNFAKVLLKFCPDAVDKEERIGPLVSSMDHFQYNNELRNFDKLNSGNIVLRFCKEVEAILDNKPLADTREDEIEPTIEDRLGNYLRKIVDVQADRYPRSVLNIRPLYKQLKSKPAFSIETFYSEQFLKQHEPSQVTVFEFVYEELDENKLNELYVKYRNFNNVKVFIASSFGLRREVRVKAKELLFGYVLINPNSEMTSENFILPRSIEDFTKRQHDLEVLAGEKPMTTPMLIFDSCMETTTLPELLHKFEVVINKHYILDIPSLSEDYIEKAANSLTKKDVIDRINLYYLFEEPNLDLSLDPFAYAKSVGLTCETKAMGDSPQLGCYDVDRCLVTLNSTGMNNYKRFRFTMAHELAHHILHAKLLKQKSIQSVGESMNTLPNESGHIMTIISIDSSKLEYQANMFASCLLMPKDLVQLMYYYFYQRYEGRNIKKLYYSPNQPETWQSHNNIVGNMARLLDVSMQAMSIRLKSLGLLTIKY